MSNNIMLFLVHFFVGVLLITNTVSALDFSSHQTTTTVDQVLERLSQLEARQVADTARIDLLESKLAEAMKNSSIFVDTAASCTCNDFPNGTITIGSPATGTMNGINVVQLSAQVDQLNSGLARLQNDVVYKSKGDQTIDGTLSVEKITIGNDWTLEMNAGGGLDATSNTDSETVDLSDAVTTDMNVQWADCYQELHFKSAGLPPNRTISCPDVTNVQCFQLGCQKNGYFVQNSYVYAESNTFVNSPDTYVCCRPCFGKSCTDRISIQKTVQTLTKKATTKKNLRIQSAVEETTDCTCDTFLGDITVGASGTGTVNGIDIVQLSTQMNQLSSDLTHLKNDVIYKSKGDQTIDGTLNVEKMTIGNDWTLETNAGGGLDATSIGARKETIDLSTVVTTDMNAQWCGCYNEIATTICSGAEPCNNWLKEKGTPAIFFEAKCSKGPGYFPISLTVGGVGNGGAWGGDVLVAEWGPDASYQNAFGFSCCKPCFASDSKVKSTKRSTKIIRQQQKNNRKNKASTPPSKE